MIGEGGKRCPEIDYAPQTPIEQAAWSAAQDLGVWRTDVIQDPADSKKSKQVKVGLRMAEVAARRGPLDPDMVDLLRAIEGGAMTGGVKGWVDPDAENEEEG